MHAHLVDRYRAGDSLIHRLDPRVKLVAAMAFVTTSSLLPDGAWWAFGLALAMTVAVSVGAGLGVGYALLRSFLALPFLAAATTVAFATPGEAVFALQVGPWPLIVTATGILRLASILARALLCVQAVILLAATTPFHDLVHALHHLRLPPLLVATLAFLYRYLFLLADEALRLMRARDARSARAPSTLRDPSPAWQARVAGQMAGQLFVRSLDRADRVHRAMLARGYQGHVLSLHPHTMRRADWLAAMVVACCIVLLQVVAWWGRLAGR